MTYGQILMDYFWQVYPEAVRSGVTHKFSSLENNNGQKVNEAGVKMLL